PGREVDRPGRSGEAFGGAPPPGPGGGGGGGGGGGSGVSAGRGGGGGAGRGGVEERGGGGVSFRVFLPDVTEVAAEAAGQAADPTEADVNVEDTDASEEEFPPKTRSER